MSWVSEREIEFAMLETAGDARAGVSEDGVCVSGEQHVG